MNKKVQHICEVLATLFLPFAKETCRMITHSLSPYAVLKTTPNSVKLDISHFTIHHLEISVLGEKNILCTLPPDFDDRELDDVLTMLTNYHIQVIEPLSSKEHKLAELEAQKEQIEQRIKAIEDEE